MNSQRLEKIGNISGYIKTAMAGILILIIFLPGLKEIDWLTAQYTIFVCGFIVLFFGGLLLTTSLGINVMRSGELVSVFVPISKPFARLFGFLFFLLGTTAVLCSLVLLAVLILPFTSPITDL
ncbi:hypothetical protein [Leptospira santarosai]|uniref:hypothetical protein n=1 Tax=Leptospira santarosai TaxID=28183 RepID=UPI0002BB8C98|nr:hypothetical protein [Leptospira santarosai]EMF91359.1 hypothetical protein LEP1GSC005_2808 [Leptospira santarosai str. ST188]EMM88103.1 hypothetical protein LEP1GSC039_3348 [Leptospira santarosai str. 2000027870]EMP01120.1 hypothetical protein LEP1GSC171_3331 [Leptospira santarosai str. HAI1380]MDI7217016.1 hypothetical protein [Leptospira santarosai]UZN08389.1 hypothetical protein M5D10_05355 [Leptospira santarosai]